MRRQHDKSQSVILSTLAQPRLQLPFQYNDSHELYAQSNHMPNAPLACHGFFMERELP
jgi:hypothetical protein